MVLLNSFGYPDSQIKHEQRNVRAILDKKDLGIGTLFVSESTLCWQEKEDVGFCIGYQDISLHAISKDQNVYPRECIYIMIDGRLTMPGDVPVVNNDDDDDDENSNAESEHEVSELVLVPNEEHAASITTIYEAIKLCQELNPDPQDMDDDDDHLYADAEDEFDEGHYVIHERGAGDADIDDISRRMQENSVEITYAQNGNDDDEFQDAD